MPYDPLAGLTKAVKFNKNEVIRAQIVANPNSFIPKRVKNFALFFASTTGAGTKKFVRADAAGGGDGSTNVSGGGTGAWTLTQANASALAPNSWMVFTGDFTGLEIAANRPGVLYDLRAATVTKATLVPAASWIPTGVNGEYKTTGGAISATGRSYCVLEDKTRMNGLHLGYSGQNILVTGPTVGNNIIMKGIQFQPKVNDIFTMVQADWAPFNRGTSYYVLTATAAVDTSPLGDGSEWSSTVTLSATPGGGVITPGVVGTNRWWTLASDMVTKVSPVPIPGKLAAGEYSWVPWDGSPSNAGAIYMKPRNGTPVDHTYHITTGVGPSSAAILVTAANVVILGGWVFGSNGNLVDMPSTASNCHIYGGVHTAWQDGLIASLAGNVKVWGNYIYDGAQHALISTDISNLESGSHLAYNNLGDTQALEQDWGSDGQHIISSPGSIQGYWHDNCSYNCGRLLLQKSQRIAGVNYPLAFNSNFAVVGLDATSFTRIENNYFDIVPGGLLFAMPAQNSGGLNFGNVSNVMRNNIFDFRQSLNYPGTRQTLTRMVCSGAAAFPNNSHVIEGNLWLPGDTTYSGSGVLNALSVSNTQSAGTPRAMTLTFANNLIVGGTPSGSSTESAMIATLYITNAFSTEPIVTTYGNVYCCPDQVNGALRYLDGSINLTTPMTSMTTYGTGPNLVVTPTVMDTYITPYGAPKNPLRGLGVWRTMQKDSEGNIRQYQATPGPSDPLRL